MAIDFDNTAIKGVRLVISKATELINAVSIPVAQPIVRFGVGCLVKSGEIAQLGGGDCKKPVAPP